MRLGLLILGAACATLAACSSAPTKWPPREPVEGAWVSPSDCDVQNKQVVDCFDQVHFVVEEDDDGKVLIMKAPVCADVTVRHWSDRLPHGVVTVFYGRPASYAVIGAASDRAVLVQCLQHPLSHPMPELFGENAFAFHARSGVHSLTNSRQAFSKTLPRVEGVRVQENPDDKVYSDRYVPDR